MEFPRDSPWPAPAKMRPVEFESHAKHSHAVFYSACRWYRWFCALCNRLAPHWLPMYIFSPLWIGKQFEKWLKFWHTRSGKSRTKTNGDPIRSGDNRLKIVIVFCIFTYLVTTLNDTHSVNGEKKLGSTEVQWPNNQNGFVL